MKFHPAFGHARLGFRHGGIFQKPLLAQTRLNRHVRALAETDVVLVGLGLDHHALFREYFHGNFAGLEPIQPGQWPTRQGVHRAVGVDDFDERQLVTRADVKVRFVVRGRDLEHAGAEFKIHVFIADDRDEFLIRRQFGGQRTHDVLADKMRVTRVFRIHGHSGVAGNRLGPRRGDGEPDAALRINFGAAGFLILCSSRLESALTIFGGSLSGLTSAATGWGFRDLHLEVIHETILRFHFHFLVGQRGLRDRAPVHHAFAAIDEILFVKLDEHLLHAAGILRVHREAFARPIARAAELLELVDDDVAVLFLPHPDALEKFLAAEIVAGFFLLLLELLFHHHLRGDACVVGAGEPKDFLAVHARLAAEDVLNRVVKDVAHVEHPGYIRRRDDDGIRGLGGLRIGGEATLLQPEVIPFVLNGLRFVGFGNLGHGFNSHRGTENTEGKI